MAVPTKDPQLVDYSTNFNTRVSAGYASYGYTEDQATQYTTLHTAFITANNAVAAARASGTRSSALVETKNLAKANLLRYARDLSSLGQASLTLANAKKIELGITVKKTEPSPRPVPDKAPAVDLVSTVGNTVTLRLHDADDAARRGKPPLVDGAAVFSFVGAAPPTTEDGWKFEGITARTTVEVTFPASVEPGSKVWFTAYWFNERKERGPSSPAIGCNLPGGASMAA